MGKEKEQIMMTGLHRIRSIKCIQCRQTIGWTYVYAYEQSEKYKENKFIVERSFIEKAEVRQDYSEEDEEFMAYESHVY